MKLGVIIQAGSTGAWRYAERLVESLLAGDHVTTVVVFYTTHYVNEIISLSERWRGRVQLAKLEPPKKYIPVRTIRLIQKRLEKALRVSTSADRNLRALEKCDVLFYPVPYYESVTAVQRPIVFIPHDFTYARNFGTTLKGPTLSEFRWQLDLHRTWFDRGTCVVSSRFVRAEIQRLFGSHHNPVVIPLSSLSRVGRLSEDEANRRVQGLGITGQYVLCVNNMCAHKNLGQLLGGFYLARDKHPDIRLVLVGAYSEEVSGSADNPYGVALSLDSNQQDVRGLGLVSDQDLIALMQKSQMVVNPSLSEAGNGSGLDAWDIGTPVAMSNIPPFLEHLDFLGVRAELFHPRCVFEIRDALERLLIDRNRAKEFARVSSEAMKKWTWTQVAERYSEVLRQAHRSG